MPKKSSNCKKGIQRTIPRHRVGRKEIVKEQKDENDGTEDSRLLSSRRSKYFSFGEKSSKISLAWCQKFHLVGFTRTQNGQFVSLSRIGQIWHYVAIVCGLALCMQRSWMTLQVFLYEVLQMESFICLNVAMIDIVGFLLGAGVIMRPKETMDLYNSWSHGSASLQKIDPGFKFHPLDNDGACLKTFFSTLVGYGVAFAVAFLSLIVSESPIFLLPMAKSIGLIPEGVLPYWAWQIMFVPLEWLRVLPFTLIAPFSGNFLYMANGALDIYVQQLRRINVTSIKSRRTLEQMYVQLELFNRIAQVWIRFFFPPWLFALSVGAIITAFVTIRYTELPLIVYLFFPYVGWTLMLMIFWQCYDMLRVIRASEDVLGKLWQHQAPYFRGMTRAKRVEKMKRSKAMRPLIFYLADCAFSVSLPINTWDEILNQLVLLLSL